jgi:phosphoribosyl-dephospho-CoA transferase
MHGYRAHDLLWLAAMPAGEALPAWASAAWLQQAPLVVRRATTAPGRLPVGLRGPARSQRHACEIDVDQVLRRVTPEMLSARVGAITSDGHR